MGKNIHDKFIQYAKKGYGKMSQRRIYFKWLYRIVEYSSALWMDIMYIDVQFEFMVCYPYEGIVLSCKVQNITKIALKE